MINEPAFPQPHNYQTDYTGLSKREYFAVLAMQGMLANGPGMISMVEGYSTGKECEQQLALSALAFADALITELSKDHSETQDGGC